MPRTLLLLLFSIATCAPSARHILRHPAGTLTFVRATSREEIRIGGVSLGRLEVVFLEDGPPEARLEAWPFAVDAVLGPSAFGDGLLVAMDLRSRRMALWPAGSRESGVGNRGPCHARTRTRTRAGLAWRVKGQMTL